jgi:hypothetical protein
MDPIAEIERAGATIERAPGLTPTEIDAIESEVGAPLPPGVRTLLEHTARVDGADIDLDFAGLVDAVATEDFFPAALPIAGDGAGNFWVVEIVPGAEAAPVFFLAHDPPVLAYQSPDVGTFLHEALTPDASAVADVRERAVFRIWRENPGELDRATALAGDDELRRFAESLDDRFTFVDLRRPQVGDGFSWGRHGPRTEMRRDGDARLYAYAAPEKKPGLLRRLIR